ncbi:unnamed protein product [Amoebophrya sp. A120]|nr:unnamed protein product [Amoebophrya sp. A120]|eukprot:GSA120T00007842001.1
MTVQPRQEKAAGESYLLCHFIYISCLLFMLSFFFLLFLRMIFIRCIMNYN